MIPLIPVVLCGGSGTRLWPLSRESEPKQFLSLHGDTSLLQQALLRLQGLPAPLPAAAPPLLVANREHRFLVATQVETLLPQQGATVVLEPMGRNTAPALTLAALQAVTDAQAAGATESPVMMVMPADHVLLDTARFHAAVAKAWPLALAGKVVTFGICPDRPETGYGYIHRGCTAAVEGVYAVKSFREKPDAAAARQMLESGEYLWNSGMFMLKAQTWLDAVAHFRPDILQTCQQAMLQGTRDADFVRPDATVFAACAAESIDYAVMEKLPAATALGTILKVVALDAGWSDLGAWNAVWEVMPQDASGNALHGDVLQVGCERSLLYSTSRLVTGIGLHGLVVVETPDAVLVSNVTQVQDVKRVVAELKSRARSLADTHRKTPRPWGWYDSIDRGERFQVKRIVVKPGASLSLQMHHHRAEHWIVVKGTAEVTNGEKTFLLSENESTYIPLGHVHRLSNPGKIPLEIIEVQSGNYLGEDDIVRLDDCYGRTP